MSHSATLNSASVNSSSKGSNPTAKVYAGYGYRFLRSGEKFTHDSEAIHMLYAGKEIAACRSLTQRGEHVKDPSGTHLPAGFYRVPTPAPAGFRVLDANEITAKGDRYHGEETPVDEKVYSNIGKTAEEAVLGYHNSGHRDAFDPKRPTCVIRKEEARAYHNPEGVNPKHLPAGYRFIFKDEVNGPRPAGWMLWRGLTTLTWDKDTKPTHIPYISSWTYAVPITPAEPTVKAEASAQEKPKDKSPVDQAIERLQIISERTGRAPRPPEVSAELHKIVADTEAPLREQIKDARQGCKRLSETIDRQRTKITELETKLRDAEARADNLRVAYQEKSTQLEHQRKNARGNIVLLRRDGFSKPMTISPVAGFGGYELPRYIECYDMPEPVYHTPYAALDTAPSYRTFRAHNTGKQDGFGRTIFEQV